MQVSVSGLGVVGARVTVAVTRVDSNGGHHTTEPDITLADDGAAGEMSYGHHTENMHSL